jgi:hypothetical protein
MQWGNVTAEGARTLDFDISADIAGCFSNKNGNRIPDKSVPTTRRCRKPCLCSSHVSHFAGSVICRVSESEVPAELTWP